MKDTRRNFALLLLTASSLIAQGPPGGGPPGGGGPGGASGDGIWRRNAYYGEFQTFDACVGHQPGTGEYHYHANPLCLRSQLGDNVSLVRSTRTGPVYQEKAANWTHSPILGWAIDGYPVYGPYGHTDPNNPSSPIKRLKSGFRLRQITSRVSLPDWSLPNHSGVSQQLTSSQYGPAISTTFPLGRYLEDFEWVSGLGDLDQYNGRTEVTPEFPGGTYAYHVTINDDGSPAFPYILAGQLYGTASGGRAQTIPTSGVSDYFNSASTTPSGSAETSPAVTSWLTQNATQSAKVASGYDPSAGASTTWPTNIPSGATYSGGATSAVQGDTQRVRYSATNVYINAAGLSGSYSMGPWFDPTMSGGVFSNFPSNQSYQLQFPRSPAAASSKTATGGGTQGLWVNGVAIFNFIDGASYSNANGADAGGGTVKLTAVEVSAASGENGPAAPGSIVSAYSLFGASLASSTAAAPSADWPTSLAGASVSVKDSAGTSRAATLQFVSPGQVNFRVPTDTASGYATVTFNNGTTSVTSNFNVLACYPNLFIDGTGAAKGYVVRVRNGSNTVESLSAPIDLGPSTDQVYVVLYGSGLGTVTSATATIGGTSTQVAYAGTSGTYPGVDQYNILVPRSLAGKGSVAVVATASGRLSNAALITIQ
jgi:uncharacterized protein (TIGR03437 family)